MRSGVPLLVLLCTAVLTGCGGGDHQDISKWMAESSHDLRGHVKPLPELKPFPVVSYDAGDQLDPFNQARLEPEKREGGGGKKPDFDRPREQLENFPLESLKFTGIISKNKENKRYALIQVDGVVYQAGVGNYLGQNFGRIAAINDNEIVIKETVQDPSGQTSDWVEREATLQLQEGATKGKEAAK